MGNLGMGKSELLKEPASPYFSAVLKWLIFSWLQDGSVILSKAQAGRRKKGKMQKTKEIRLTSLIPFLKCFSGSPT